MLNSTFRRKNAILMIAVLLLSTFGVFQMSTSYAIHGNDVIDGGVSSEKDLQKIVQDDSSNPHAHHIFNKAFGGYTSKEDMTGMVKGSIHKDGRVTVDGKTVAKNAHTSGRKSFSSHDQVLARNASGDPVAYHAPAKHRFSVDVQSTTVLVKLDDKGEYQHAVLTNCGNPVIAEPVPVEEEPEPEPAPEPEPVPQPAFECKDLKASRTVGTKTLTTKFTAIATAKNTKILQYEFNFGDADGLKVTKNNKVFHTYKKPGTYTARVNVVTEDGETGNQSQCQVDVKVKKPEPKKAAFECIDLTASKTVGTKKLKTKFTASASVQNTKITGYRFVFGDGNSKTSTNNTVTHTYNQPGTYTAKVNIQTEHGKTGFTKDCKVKVKVKKPEPQPEPAFECISLEASETKGAGKLETTFTANANAEVTEIESYNFDFGDGETRTVTSNNDQVTTEHTYTEPGDYIATVTITTGAGTTEVEEECKVGITVDEVPEEAPEEEEEKEGKVEQPEELANTGFGGPLVALFGSGALGMGIRGWLISRRKLINSLMN